MADQIQYLIPPGKVFTLPEIRAMLAAPGSRFELEEIVLRGVTYRYYKNAPRDMRALLRISLAHGEKPFMVLNNERISYEEHFKRVATLAHAMIKMGVKKGDRVALLMRNLPEWPIVFWAAISAGAIIVPINGWLKPLEIQYCLTDSGSKWLFADRERLVPILPLIPKIRTDKSNPPSCLAHVVVVRHDKLDGKMSSLGVKRFADVMAVGKPVFEKADDLPELEIDGDEDATLFYTSGTTGRPKGAQGTHINFITNLFNGACNGPTVALRTGAGLPDPDTVPPAASQPAIVMGVPLFHVTGCHAIMGGCLVGAQKMVLMDRWDPEVALKLIEREKVTTVGGVPALLWQMIEHPKFAKYDTSSVISYFTGGAPFAPELGNAMRKAMPQLKMAGMNGYGLTETSALACSNVGPDLARKPDSIGMPCLVNDFMIVKPGTLERRAVGEVGEIAIKGPNVVKGYWNRPEANAKSFMPGGWFLTGDVGKMDEEGFVYVLDRAKDMLIRGGENVYCVEVEDAIFSHEAVMDCGVVGLPHKILGEEVAAVVQISPAFKGKVRPEDIMAHCREKIAKFKCPVYVEIRDEPLPRNANGKIVKGVLREQVIPRAKKMGFAKL
ncbi:hypothetical protein HK101_001225 [Irineochytrium annulatum]|nr:hypothetical protein HK101_001225 [Irineochytrium annulatum]